MTDVLVVDDDAPAARRFASYIEGATKLVTVHTDDPTKAIELVKQHDIKTVVLDQKMPAMTGTALFRLLREIDPDIMGILFSGQADRADLEDALRQRGDTVEFLDKNNIERLPAMVRIQYEEYLARLANKSYDTPERLLEYRSGFSLRGAKVVVTLQSIGRIASTSEVWLEDEFKCSVRLNSGDTVRFQHSSATENQVVFEEEVQTKTIREIQGSTKAVFAAPVKLEIAAQAKMSIEAVVRTKFQRTHTTRTERISEVTYTLPANEVDPLGRVVRVREIQEAPIYERHRAVIEIR